MNPGHVRPTDVLQVKVVKLAQEAALPECCKFQLNSFYDVTLNAELYVLLLAPTQQTTSDTSELNSQTYRPQYSHYVMTNYLENNKMYLKMFITVNYFGTIFTLVETFHNF